MRDMNGCNCQEIRKLVNMPIYWKCISCKDRAKAKLQGHCCKKCGVGLRNGEYNNYTGRHPNICTICRWKEW